jgi:hypothetical protein
MSSMTLGGFAGQTTARESGRDQGFTSPLTTPIDPRPPGNRALVYGATLGGSAAGRFFALSIARARKTL